MEFQSLRGSEDDDEISEELKTFLARINGTGNDVKVDEDQ